MQFKVGDMVRLTREAIEESVRKNWCVNYWAVVGGEVIRTSEDQSFVNTAWQGYPLLNQDLELVPEEPEFEYGENIEVKIGEWFPWVERPFIYFAKWNAIHPYITANINKAQFDAWKKFDFQTFRYARKLKPQLTRREIAEKFWVSEDFTLID